MFLIFRPPHRPNLVNEAMPKGWPQMRISQLRSSLKMVNRWSPRRTQLSLCINVELLLGTMFRSAFKNGLSKKNLEGASYVSDRTKDVLWDKLRAKFTLPVLDCPEKTEAMTKKSSISLLRRWLNNSIITRIDYTVIGSWKIKFQISLQH